MRVRKFFYLSLLFSILNAAPFVCAQSPQPEPQATQSSETETTQSTQLTAAEYQKAKSYSRARYTHYFVGEGYGLAILALFIALRFGPKLQRFAERMSSRRILQTLIYGPLFILTLTILLAPIDAWDHALAINYGLSVQSWRSWFADWMKAELLSLFLGTVLILILYAVIRRSPRRYWLYFWIACLPLLLLVLFVAPVVIEPMFFKFEPLQPRAPELVSEVEKLVKRAGIDIPQSRMFEMNASSKSTGLNAYVDGFGSTKRVVVWDTMLQKATIPETLVVFGHEMGHYVLLHIPKQIAIDAAIFLVLLYTGFRIVKKLQGRWGVTSDAELASLPILIIVFSILGFLATPAFTGVSRHFEHEADRYALEVTHGIVPSAREAGVHFFEISRVTNLSDPDPNPFIVFWLFDHPSDPDRIHFMQTYDPWSSGHSPKYVK